MADSTSSAGPSTGGQEGSSSSGGADSTGGEPLTRIEQILSDLTIAMYECPDRVWPGNVLDNYRSRQVLLASVDENAAWLWNDQAATEGEPPRVTNSALDQLPQEWTSRFNVGAIGGVPTLGISLDFTAELNDEIVMSGGELYRDFASILTFHEGFHFLSGQSDWNVPAGSRAAPYPEPWEPRYLRAELIRSLRAVLEDGAPLGSAAFWHARLLAEFADEMDAIRPYDVLEGSAEYAALISSALAVQGCDYDEAALIDEAIAHLDDDFQGVGFNPGREPYDLGVLSGLLLRMAKVPGWEAQQENGHPPTEQLLATVDAVEQPDDPALQADVQDAVDQRNAMVGAEIDPMLADLVSPEAVRVVVSFGWVSGSFGVGGFYYLPEQPGQPQVFLQLSALFDLPGAADVTLTGETSLVGVDTPCAIAPGQSIVLTLPASEVAVADGLATSTAATATFTGLAVESTTDPEGLTWLCPVDGGGADAAPLPPQESAPIPAPRHVVPVGDRLLVIR